MASLTRFLSGIASVFEHILSLNAILDNAKIYGLPLSLTYIDLKKGFESVLHKLINDMLQLVSVTPWICDYVTDVYSKLTTSFY